MKRALILFLFPLFLIGVFGDDVESVSVMEGDSVTLHTNRNISKDEVFEWKQGDIFFAIVNCGKNGSIVQNVNETVKDRVQMDSQTGDLKIMKIKDSDSGHYKLMIEGSSSKEFSLVVSGAPVKTVSLMVGDSVTLNTGVPEPQRYGVIQWMFKKSLIAEINRKIGKSITSNTERLNLDYWTGSLTIRNTETKHSGDYEVDISTSNHTIHKSFTVTVSDPGLSPGDIAAISVAVLLVCVVAAAGVIYYRCKISELKPWGYKEKILSVMEGDSTNLIPDGVHKYDKLLWMFGNSCIAERESAADSFTVYDDVHDGRFKLKPDPQTGSLTIPITRTTDSGVYELLIIRKGNISIKRFRVFVFDDRDMKPEPVSVKEGESVTLPTDVDDIQKVEQIQWMFGLDTLLAEIKVGTKKVSPLGNVIFQGRLELDQTGSLTIKNIRRTDAGIYMRRKINGENIQTFLFFLYVWKGSGNNPEILPLRSVHADSGL